jgi:lipoprotein-releasing system permease protein
MYLTRFIALRYLRTQRENRFFSWISGLTVLGIAIGVSIMIVVLAVIDGFEEELRNRFLAANAHVLLYRFPTGITHPEKWTETIQQNHGKEITGMSPFIHGETLGRKSYLIHSLLIRGIEPRLRQHVQSMESIIFPPSALDLLQQEVDDVAAGKRLPSIPSIILGKAVLKAMEGKVGDTVELAAPTSKPDENGKEKDLVQFKVVGVYDSGLQHYDSRLGLLSIPAAQQLFQMGDTVTGLEIGMKHPNESPQFAAQLTEEYQVSVKEWQSFNSNIFEAMRNERNVISWIVFLVAFVASFNILTTLFISVTQKRRDISILKAMGATNQNILATFVQQSLFMGIIGGTIGMALAFGLSCLLERFEIIKLPDIYLLTTLPVKFDPMTYGVVFTASLVIASVAGIYPAWLATQVTPAQGITDTRET